MIQPASVIAVVTQCRYCSAKAYLCALLLTYHTAALVHNGRRFAPPGTCIGINDEGVIKDITTKPITDNVKVHKGLLCPGFINAHCHLELSYLHKAIPMHTGLVKFLQAVNELNALPQPDLVQAAIGEYDRRMYAQGIVAVADICNTTNTISTKQTSDILYHNFVEVFGAIPQYAAQKLQTATEIYTQFRNALGNATITPHSAYSISSKLFSAINAQHTAANLLSIHNQESAEEDKLFQSAEGEFVGMLKAISENIPIVSEGYSALRHHITHLNNMHKCLFVHNTYTTIADVMFAQKHVPDRYWCVCPNANEYIEQRINPLYAKLHEMGEKVVIGTDSLASNTDLCMVHEMHTLQRHQADLEPEEMLVWATSNGANMLQLPQLGVLELGRKPGIVNVPNWTHRGKVPEGGTGSVVRLK
jgi:aminodeoxyfutalosine deaminase